MKFCCKRINLFFVFWFSVVLASCSAADNFFLESAFGDEKSVLGALNSSAKNNEITKSTFACYQFSSEQEKIIKNHLENQSVALVVRLKFEPTQKESELLATMPQMLVKIGFLSDRDFSDSGKFISKENPDSNNITVQGNLINFISFDDKQKFLDVSIAFKNTGFDSRGFFVFSSVHCFIESVCIAPAQLGFDFSLEVPFYGFSCNGGSLRFGNSGFDFSGGNLIFSGNPQKKLMPEFFVRLDLDDEHYSTSEKEIFTEMNFGGEKLYIKNVTQKTDFTIPCSALKNPFAGVDCSSNSSSVKTLIQKENTSSSSSAKNKAVTVPVKMDPGLIVDYPVQNWRCPDYEIFMWDRLSNIIFFDTKDYDVQDNFFRRLAFFVEKAGFKGQLLTNAQLEGKHGYNAHDYSAESLAEFFNAATRTNFSLNEEELILKQILIENGLFDSDGEFVKANGGAVVSISQNSQKYLRVQLLAHEAWHTLFFTDEEFRNFVAAVYYTMDVSAREFLTDYFLSQPSLGYDVDDDYLMLNEFMAYTLQQPYSAVAKYFVDHAKWNSVQKYTPVLAGYIIDTNARAFEDVAVMMNDFVFNKYGISCGNISLIRR